MNIRSTNELIQVLPDPYRTMKLPKPAPAFGQTMWLVAGLAVVLGLVVEAALLLAAVGLDRVIEGRAVLADLIQKISWSVLVCLGLALGREAGRTLALTAQALVLGLAGLVAAPLGFFVARFLHQQMQEALFIKSLAGGGASPLLLALIKGVEYGCLGALLVWVAKRTWVVWAGVALGVALVFGACLLGVTVWAMTAPASLATLLPRVLGELIHPVGCALTLCAAEGLGSFKEALAEAM